VVAGYSDADWADNADDKKSTSGGCFYVGNNLVARMSRQQSSISLSTDEAEYIAAGSYCTQLLWMKKLLCDYGFTVTTQVPSIFPRIQFSTLVPSTLTSDNTSFVILWNPE
jgi:hypothetical protein